VSPLVPRRARPQDAAQVARLYAQLVANPGLQVLPGRLGELAHASDAALFVVEEDGQLVGTVLVALCPDVMFGRRPFAVRATASAAS